MPTEKRGWRGESRAAHVRKEHRRTRTTAQENQERLQSQNSREERVHAAQNQNILAGADTQVVSGDLYRAVT